MRRPKRRDGTSSYPPPSRRDPLIVRNPKVPCAKCGGKRRFRRSCEECESTGYARMDLQNFWYPSSAFLVCGGPSLATMPLDRLRERGVLSLGINNAGAYAPCSAMTFGDPQWKFHFGAHLDGKTLTFAPYGKCGHQIRAKLPDGTFRQLNMPLALAPGVVAYGRSSRWNAATFLTTTWAHWGPGGRCSDANRALGKLASMMLGFRLLHYLGCPSIYLIGADFWNTNEQGYAWASERSGGNRQFAKQNAMLAQLKPVFDAAGFRVYNATPGSKCDVFPMVSFDDAYRACKGPVPDEPWDMGQWYWHSRQKEDIGKWPNAITPEQLAEIQHGPRPALPEIAPVPAEPTKRERRRRRRLTRRGRGKLAG